MATQSPNVREPSLTPSERLDSWKEIAAYLNCSERTVRRWEQEGLPVHRHVHKSKAAIYAYRAEIDAWWRAGHERLTQTEPPTDESSPEIIAEAQHTRTRSKVMLLAVTTVAVITVAGLFGSWTSPGAAPKLQAVIQLTNDAMPKEGHLATDGTRVYFNEGQSGNWRIAQVSVNGGNTAPVETRFNNLQIAGMAPDNSTLLALVGGLREPYDLWLLPLPAGEPRHLPQKASDAAFFPDGRIAFSVEGDLYVAQKDASRRRKLVQSSDGAWNPGVSPDGKRIVFDSSSLQETTASADPPRDVLQPEWKLALACCGQWTPDGRHLVFQVEEEGRSDLWALPMRAGFLQHPRPLRLTQGPLSYTNPMLSRDGKQIFAIGAQRRGELIRYDEKSGMFVPYLSGISATAATVSADGALVSYLAYPGQTLWRSRTDGSERVQLTYSPNAVIYPMISPDGRNVVFGMNNAVYVLSMNGGSPRKIADDSIAGAWSADGNFLILTSTIPDKPHGEQDPFDLKTTDLRDTELRVADLRNGSVSVVPDSRRKDGAYWVTRDTIVAATRDNTQFLLFDFKTKKWTPLASGLFVNWYISPDRKWLYCATGGDDPSAMRVRFDNGRVEKIASLKSLRRVVDSPLGTWLGVSPDGSVLLTRDVGLQEVYALNVSWP